MNATATAKPPRTFVVDLADGPLIALPDLPDHLPSRKGEPPIKPSTVRAWASVGRQVRGGARMVKLPCIQFGRTRYTNLAAVTWWLNQLGQAEGAPSPAA